MDESTIVIDIGSYYIKYGFNSQKNPYLLRNNLCYYPKNGKFHDYEIGYGKSNTTSTYPVENSIIKKWDELENILDKIFYYDLDIDDFSKVNIMRLVPSYESKESQLKFMDIIFNTYKFRSYQSISKTQASLLATGRTTGLVIDIGHDISTINPIYEGYMINGYNTFSTATGKQLTKAIEEKYNISYEKACYIKDMIYKRKLHHLINYDDMIKILSKSIRKSISSIAIDVRKDIGNNIILTGYTTKSDIFVDGLKNSLKEFNIVKIENREIINWIGAKIITQLSSFKYKWITREDYISCDNEQLLKKLI